MLILALKGLGSFTQWGQKIKFVYYDWWISIDFVGFCFSVKKKYENHPLNFEVRSLHIIERHNKSNLNVVRFLLRTLAVCQG